MQLDDLLNRKELLDSLETEPLVDYLQKHGVLDQECCSKILSASESFDRNRQLLHSLMKYHRSEEDRDLIEEVPKQPSENGGTSYDAKCCRGSGDELEPEEELKLSLNAFGLFMNALRHTGYHRLASLLDNERRIHKPTIGSRASLIATGYHARSRRNGQIGIILQVGAVKVSAPEYGLEAPPAPAKSKAANGAKKGEAQPASHWINLADFGAGEFNPQDARRRAASYADFPAEVVWPPLSGEVEAAKKKSCCFLCCCCCCFRGPKRKAKRQGRSRGSKMNGHSLGDGGRYELQPLTDHKALSMKSMSDDQIIKAYKKSLASNRAKLDSEMSEEERRILQMKADILNEKSEQFYQLLFNPESSIHENLLKYFEQERGVLVLDCFFDDAFMVVAICTKRAELMALKNDIESGAFCRDLERCLLLADVLSTIGVKAVKLTVDFDDSEFREALSELS